MIRTFKFFKCSASSDVHWILFWVWLFWWIDFTVLTVKLFIFFEITFCDGVQTKIVKTIDQFHSKDSCLIVVAKYFALGCTEDTRKRTFGSLHSVAISIPLLLWEDIQSIVEDGLWKRLLLIGLFILRNYPTEETATAISHCDQKTWRKMGMDYGEAFIFFRLRTYCTITFYFFVKFVQICNF